MLGESTDVSGLVEEYNSIFPRSTSHLQNLEPENKDFLQLKSILVKNANWTPQAAHELLVLAKHYGVFMLRNALAIAVVTAIEDGDSGF